MSPTLKKKLEHTSDDDGGGHDGEAGRRRTRWLSRRAAYDNYEDNDGDGAMDDYNDGDDDNVDGDGAMNDYDDNNDGDDCDGRQS